MRWRTTVIERAFAQPSAILKLSPEVNGLGPQHRHIVDQLFRSASAVGACLEEAEAASSRRDMAHKQGIALREAREAEYWLRMLLGAGVLPERLQPLRKEAGELVAILTVSVKKLRQE
ncbi:MAG: four helix bundle protein [Acidobacteria bacterium]|nr:MAG: four helix bundle protein [Acidobacteriota bacterium]